MRDQRAYLLHMGDAIEQIRRNTTRSDLPKLRRQVETILREFA